MKDMDAAPDCTISRQNNLSSQAARPPRCPMRRAPATTLSLLSRASSEFVNELTTRTITDRCRRQLVPDGVGARPLQVTCALTASVRAAGWLAPNHRHRRHHLAAAAAAA